MVKYECYWKKKMELEYEYLKKKNICENALISKWTKLRILNFGLFNITIYRIFLKNFSESIVMSECSWKRNYIFATMTISFLI